MIDTIHARPDGKTVTAGGKAGFLAGFGGLSVGPVVSVDYARAKIEGYTESGDPVLTLNVGAQKADSLLGNAGLELRGNFSSGGLAVSPYAAVTAERELQGDGRIVRYSETAAPTIVNSFAEPRRSRDTHGRVTAGASLALGGDDRAADPGQHLVQPQRRQRPGGVRGAEGGVLATKSSPRISRGGGPAKRGGGALPRKKPLRHASRGPPPLQRRGEDCARA